MVDYQDLSEFECGVTVGTREMGHSISEGFPSRRPTRALLLTTRHKDLRLAWARKHRHWAVKDWKHDACSDESRFQLNTGDGRVQVWRQPHESMDPICQQEIVQDGGGSVTVWDVCS
ncbi:transposable element Tcb2 transposase [Trichonephila clavipes]|nr:transposable element Tcb2 transposase [Trichonephila clavipes]